MYGVRRKRQEKARDVKGEKKWVYIQCRHA
jgi:hypothetical protein